MTPPFDVAAFRAHFPSLDHLVYLNSGSYGLLANEVRAGFDAYLDRRVAKGADWPGWVGELEALRATVARLLGADPDEIAITASATGGYNSIASALDFTNGRDTILVTDADFPTGAQIWHAQEPAARVIHVAEDGDAPVSAEAVAALIDERTAIVALSHLCYRHGARLPDATIRAIVDAAHAKGALVLLDSYQIVGTTPIDAPALGVDILVGGMLKYLLGTAGVGFLYVRRPVAERLRPRSSGWFAQADVNAMDIHANDPSPSARRFEAGTPPVPSLAPARAGIELVLDAGVDAIEAQVRDTTRYLMDALDAAGIAFTNPRDDDARGPLVSIPSTDAPALVAALADRNIVVSSRDGRIRAGFHAYNHRADADALLAALKDLSALLP
ncbi:aminotransferase class V-fold PLP-dependent enzyme [Sphingomonas nostoxanthinifaciens]|uniref:aminotransferase class V-fold PLP-dependent enzyme n=1 Tax=Sphingomonas nostoxanthinifaciens TaxID=2872652 RepID=UPI001CC20BE9|nr:aminotransferase class V-fold PLP-dependent enzyme [Sphingomonas nostoxanthinifaciens]UAK25080.1 aminotransferase class V-fold PLP-dependent enzyme [Sphingomonas nostoxanthinifaciens]